MIRVIQFIAAAFCLLVALAACGAPPDVPATQSTPGWTGHSLVIGSHSTIAGSAAHPSAWGADGGGGGGGGAGGGM
jgi:hypothetical protein